VLSRRWLEVGMSKQPLPSLANERLVPVDEPPFRAAPVAVPDTVPPKADARVAVYAKISQETSERLRVAVFKFRRERQDILEEALVNWLRERGI